jgi:integrase
MATRRAPSVTAAERPAGSGRWSVRWREHGKQREERGYPSEGEAQDRASQIRARLRSGLPGKPDAITVRQLIGQWWDGYLPTKSEATRTNYRTSVERILDTIGEADATTLAAPNLIAWSDDLDAMLGSGRLVNECLKVLSSAYQRGVEWGTVEANPVRSVPRRAEAAAHVVIPTREEAARLGITAPSLRDRTRLCVAAYAGLRPGEQIALQWRHIGEGHIRVLQATNLRGTVGPTKTGKPRTVPIPPSLETLLAHWRNESPFRKPGDPVFASKRGTRLSPTPWRRDVWNPWRDTAEVPHIQWRTLRHYYASQVAAAGGTILQASRWMGHGTIRTTMDRYAHLFDEDAERVMRSLG